jgi:hypothetical protein
LQDLKTLVVENLNPLSPEVISRQATINIGMHGTVTNTAAWVVGIDLTCGKHTAAGDGEFEQCGCQPRQLTTISRLVLPAYVQLVYST